MVALVADPPADSTELLAPTAAAAQEAAAEEHPVAPLPVLNPVPAPAPFPEQLL